MKKLWLSYAVASTLLLAEGMESLEAQLEQKKVTSNKSVDELFTFSLILDASYTHINFENENEKEHLEIPAFIHGGGHGHEGHSHTTLAGDEGFNLNYAELSIGASVDNYFDLLTVLHISEDDVEIEEAYVTTRSLPYHLRGRLGKFKSDFGYLNSKHHHNYNFSDIPLVYQSILGEHGLQESGVQLQYVLPTSHYVMLGLEALMGENEQSFGHDGFAPHEADENFQGIEESTYPSLWIGYLKSSVDIAGGTLLSGLSIAQGDSHIDHLEDEENAHAFAGDTTLYGVDLTYKYYFTANQAFTLQGEYLYREMDGTRYLPNDTEDAWEKEIALQKEQSGFYTELVYQHDKNWRGGVRYSAISQNDITANDTKIEEENDMYITTAMLEYNPSEFSRVRLQYNHNSSLYDDVGQKNNKDEIILQFNYAIGAHGAHTF